MKAKDIPEVTEFLANNDRFKKAALGVHQTKKGWFKDIESYLDK
jgi:hypothetical protein